MDKQKTQRIIGILVIIAFVIVLIPLFFGKSEENVQLTSVKAPPIQDQPAGAPTLAKADVNEGQTPDDSAIMGSATPVNNPANPQAAGQTGNNPAEATQINNEVPAANTTGQDNPQNNDPTSAAAAPINDETQPLNDSAAEQAPAAQNINADNPMAPTAKPADDKTSPIAAPIATEMKTASQNVNPLEPSAANATQAAKRDIFSDNSASAQPKKHRLVMTEKKRVKPVNLSSAEIEKLTSTAWVVQMGNFKDKNNARRLADKLRVAGYKAFTKEIKSAKGTVSTRVYIGPEFKQASAIQLSSKVEQEMKMRGIVVSIKPLEL